MIVDRFVQSLDDRLRLSPVVRKALAKIFPDHWSFMLGEIALYSFVSLVLTGIYLTFFFDPSSADRVYTGEYAPLDGTRTSAAYASAVRLSYDVRAGLLIRQTHHWAALVFVGAIVLHLMRIFFTGAFRKPREINWLIGLTMLILALVNGFTGYSMPDDLLSGTGLRIIFSVVQSIPIVGAWLVFLLFGGEFPSDAIIPRMFVTHVFLVPAVLVALITLHLAILIRQKHSQFPGPGRTEHNVVGSRFWPGYTLRTLALFAWVLAVLFALGGLAQINPVWIYGPFEPAQATSPAQPDWYVAWGDGALRLFPAVEFRIFGYLVPSPFLPGVVVGGVTFVILYLWPFAERLRTREKRSHQLLDPPRRHPVRLGIGVGGIVFYFVLLVAAADDIIARLTRASVTDVLWVLRVLVLALPVPAGLVAYLIARALAKSDSPGLAELTRADVRRGAGDAPPAEGAVGPAPEPAPEGGDREPVEPSALVELWSEGELWRWRYRDDAHDVTITSNETFPSEQEATAAARLAYPGVEVLVVPSPPPVARRAKPVRKALRGPGGSPRWCRCSSSGRWSGGAPNAGRAPKRRSPTGSTSRRSDRRPPTAPGTGTAAAARCGAPRRVRRAARIRRPGRGP